MRARHLDLDLNDIRVRAATVRALQGARRTGVDTQELRDRRDGIIRDLALLTRQLDGYTRPVAPGAGVTALEYHPPAQGRYREELLAERDRLESELAVLELALRHLDDPSGNGRTETSPATTRERPEDRPPAGPIGELQ